MKRALIFALGSSVIWGCLPLFWRALEPLPPLYILSSRILWATVFSGILILAVGRGSHLAAMLRDRKLMLRSAGAGWMIAFNWFLGIAAVNSGRTLDSTMGSFLNSLSCCLFAYLFFHEIPGRLQAAGISVAVAGVVWMTACYGRMPWIALSIAGTFGVYSTLKKNASLDALCALFLEGLAVVPLCLPYVIASELRAQAQWRFYRRGASGLYRQSGLSQDSPLSYTPAACAPCPWALPVFCSTSHPFFPCLLHLWCSGSSFPRHILQDMDSSGLRWFYSSPEALPERAARFRGNKVPPPLPRVLSPLLPN